MAVCGWWRYWWWCVEVVVGARCTPPRSRGASLLVRLRRPTAAAAQHSFVQGVAAAQAGISVVQPNVGRTRDW
jgi:hypothetical protein